MPTRFRTLAAFLPTSIQAGNGGPDQSATGSNPQSLPTTDSSVLEQNREPSFSEVNEPRDLGTVPPDEKGSESGLHEYIKNTDFWFNLELSQIEKYAVLQAGLHAQAGLPRQDAPALEELEIEKVLRGRATELFLGWSERVRRKVRDGIQAACVAAGDGLVNLRHSLAQLELANHNLAITELQMARREREIKVQGKTLEYGSLLSTKLYWVLLAILVMVDWVANLPVFSELLPKDAGAEQAWQQLVANSERYGLFAGMDRLIARITFSPEVSVLAFGVVVFLLFLGHVCGSSVRRLVAFRPKDEPSVEFGLESHRRQAWLPLIGSVVGIALVLSFLFFSRAQLMSVTQARLDSAKQVVSTLNESLANATARGDLNAIDISNRQLADAQAVLEQRKERADYSAGISAMNLPIFLLNITLVITAAAASYLENSATIETQLADPKTAALETKLSTLRLEALTQTQRLRVLDSEIQTNLAKAHYLSQALPLRDWPAKAERLSSAVALFRAENARQRGVDVHNIAPFQRNVALELPLLDSNEALGAPSELMVWEDTFKTLRAQIASAQSLGSIKDVGQI